MIHPVLREGMRALYAEASRLGLHPRITSTYRSRATQARLYRAFLQGRSRWPAARPGHSLHQYGLAFDMLSDDMARLGAIWESWGGRWGGRFNDAVHYELRTY